MNASFGFTRYYWRTNAPDPMLSNDKSNFFATDSVVYAEADTSFNKGMIDNQGGAYVYVRNTDYADSTY